MGVPTFRIVTICGSMRYSQQMIKLAIELSMNGDIVLMPFVSNWAGGKPADETKHMLDRMHLVKIDMSDCIYVVGSYRGESTTREMEYARKTGKLIHERVYV